MQQQQLQMQMLHLAGNGAIILLMKKRKDELNDPSQSRSRRLSSCGWYFGVLGTFMDTKMKENLEPLGLSLSQFAIIMTLLENDGLTQVDIAQKAMLPAYTTSRNIDKLESFGYVQRRSHSSSRRSHQVLLTEKGEGLAPALFVASKNVNDLILAPLTEDQKDELLALLGILAIKWVQR